MLCEIIALIAFILSAIPIIISDYKYSKIPTTLIIINYITLCLAYNQWMLLGLIYIIIAKKYNLAIDGLYITTLCYMLYGLPVSLYCIIAIIIPLLHICISDAQTVSYMISLEISHIILLLSTI